MNISDSKNSTSDFGQSCERCLSEADLARLAGADSERWLRRLPGTVHSALDDIRFQAIGLVRKPVAARATQFSATDGSNALDSVLTWAGFAGGKRQGSPRALLAACGLAMCVFAMSNILTPGVVGGDAEICLTCEALVKNLCAI